MSSSTINYMDIIDSILDCETFEHAQYMQSNFELILQAIEARVTSFDPDLGRDADQLCNDLLRKVVR